MAAWLLSDRKSRRGILARLGILGGLAGLALAGCTGPADAPVGGKDAGKGASEPVAIAPPSGALPPSEGKTTESATGALADFNRGAALLEQYKYADAVPAFESALQKYPDWTAARFNLGLALLNMQDEGGASGALERSKGELLKIVEKEPDHRWAHFCLGVYHQHVGKSEESLAHYQKVHELDPGDPYAAYKCGEALMSLSRYDEAEKVFEGIIDKDYGFVSAFYRLGNLYNRTGKREKAVELFKRFKELNNEELAVGSYGVRDPYAAMGKYYMALSADGIPAAREAGGQGAGARLLFSPEVRELDVDLKSWAWSGGEVGLAGMAVGDVDGDGDDDVLLAGQGEKGAAVLLLNDGAGKFTSTALPVDEVVAPCLGDIDNDGDLDIWAGRQGDDAVLLNDGKGIFTAASGFPPAAGAGLTGCARLVDIDSDGDLDLLSTRIAGGNLPVTKEATPAAGRVLLNKLDGSYSDIASNLGLDFGDVRVSALLSDDFDGDRDIDLVVLSPERGPLGWENYRVGRHKMHDGAETGLEMPASISATSGDPFKTNRRDVLVFSGTEVKLFRNEGGWRFKEDEKFRDSFGSLGGTGGQFVDIDNDGDQDVLITDAHRKEEGKRGPVMLVNQWPEERFINAGERDAGFLLNNITTPGDAAGVAADFNGDGACDILLAPMNEKPILIENLTKGGKWIALDLLGKRMQDQTSRSPNSAIGARVELRAGRVTQQYVVGVPTGATAMAPLRIHAGLGEEDVVQWLRILWPDSILQAELELAANRVIPVTEICRRTTSCPHLFAWNGERFEFVSDFGGVGGLGYLVSPGEYAAPDSSEYVKLPELRPLDGDFVVQVAEPLEEIVYFDKARLLVVDHPEDTELYPNEMAAVSAPPPTFELFCIESRLTPLRAVDRTGAEVTKALARSDRVCAGPRERDRRFAGYAEEHAVELDFGDKLKSLAGGTRLVLLLDGWVEYSTSTSNMAASQAGLRLRAPSVFVERGEEWVELAHEAGYPAGIHHVMTLELTDKLLPSDQRLRITTNMDISWDMIGFGVVRSQADVRVRELGARRADLHFLGYPREYSPDGRKPTLLDYSTIDRSTTWLQMPGAYTRYGEVTELVGEADDRFVIMSPGDEITLRFAAGDLEPPPAGFARTFIMDTDSYCKDMDLYTGGSERVEPLPFHGMTKYPYGPEESYPDGEAHQEYRSKYNTRVMPD